MLDSVTQNTCDTLGTTMSHETFYRKYRSQTFDQIVGQDHIKQTLKNAIENDRLTHAYIFSGPRGTGKTSTARILAKSLNCREGKGVQPCLKCDLCLGISNGTSVDVIEIDAASNTGVDNIRELNEKINFMPVECLYKMYIIDEVHMLSTGAFNALLKTLEEPPQNTIFILATTEPHKIPVTIHSRCQQLHFRNLTLDEITTQLRMITTEESITADDKSIHAIARNAGGCMRDALSLLNQVYSFKGESFTYEDVLFILGSTEDKHLITFLKTVFSGDEPKIIESLQTFINDGANVMQLVADLLVLLQRMLLIKNGLQDEIDVDEGTLNDLKASVSSVSNDAIKLLLDAMAKTELEMRWFSRPELLLQIRCLTALSTPQVAVQPAQQAAPQPTAQPVQAAAPTPPPVPKPPLVPAAQPRVDIPDEPVIQKPQVRHAPIQKSEQIEDEAPAKPAQASAPATNTSLQGLWEKALDGVKKEKSALFGVLKGSRVQGKEGGQLTIILKQDFKFFREKVLESENAMIINTHATQAFGESLHVVLPGQKRPEAQSVSAGTGSKSEGSSAPASPIQKEPTVSLDQRINDVVSMFEGSIV